MYKGVEVVQRYDMLAAEVGMADAEWHKQHVHIASMAFADAAVWLDRFVAESNRCGPCLSFRFNMDLMCCRCIMALCCCTSRIQGNMLLCLS